MASADTSVRRVGLLWRGTEQQRTDPFQARPRLRPLADALAAARLLPVPLVYDETFVTEIEATLLTCDLVLVWVNPIEDGRDRQALNALLKRIASAGVLVSAHPQTIARLGVKEVLYHTRHLPFGSDVRKYDTIEELERELLPRLRLGEVRVLKRSRGQSGEFVWKVSRASHAIDGTLDGEPSLGPEFAVQPARRGAAVELMPWNRVLELFGGIFNAGDALVDQPWISRITEGMIRCYLVGAHVAGFGYQAVNLLLPPAPGQMQPPLPTPREYFGPDEPSFRDLCHKLKQGWVSDLCDALALTPQELPLIWDLDFMFGPKDASGADTYTLCEINVSCVDPFPRQSIATLVEEVRKTLAASRPRS